MDGSTSHLEQAHISKSFCNMPWKVIGDLNEILYSFKKEGGND